MIYEAPFLQSTYLILQNINDVVDIIDGVVIDDDQRSQLTKQSSMTNVKWMLMMVCMGGQKTETGGSIWWHGKGVSGVTEWNGCWKCGVQ